MEGRLNRTTRHPVMKLLIDFNDLGYAQKDNWVDVTDDILDISGSKEKSGRQIGSVTSDIATFTTDNTDKKYSNDNPSSPFKGKIKSNLKFRLLTGFKNEVLVPYASGYIEAFSPSWRDQKILIKATDYFKLFKEEEVPEESYQDISWDALVNILCDHVGLPDFIIRNIPKTEFYYNYFKFEEENCFEALKSLMEIAVGEAYFEQEQLYVKTKLALDYQLDVEVDHDITVDDMFDFEENVDGQNIINSLSVSSQYKTIAPLEVVFSTPDNVVKIENEQIIYTGGNYITIDTKNLPMINNEENPIAIKNLTQGRTIYINGHNARTGRIDIHPDSLAYLAPKDILAVSYSYQQLALLAGQTRKYTFVLNQEVDSLQALDIALWDENGDQVRNYSETANTPNTVSKQGMTFDKKTNTVTLTLKNNYADPTTISTLQFRGYPIKVIAPIEVYVKDLPSITEFGKKEISLQNNYLNNIKLAEKIGQYIVDNNKGNRKRINIDIVGYPEFSLDDISKVTEASSGTSHKFTNERIDYTFNPDSGWNVKAALLELDSAPWVYESFKGESWQKTDSGTPDEDFLKDINANLIKNGGAELYTGFSDYNDIGAISQKHIIPDYWRFVRSSGNATSRIRDGGNLVLHGLHSFEITTSDSGSGYFEQIINGIKPSAVHTLSFVANPVACSGKATVLQYEDNVLVHQDTINITAHSVYELIISSLASTNAVVIRIEKLAGSAGSESLVFDKVKFENSKEKTTYIESEETTSVQVGQRYANSLLIGNQYGLEVIDDMNNTRVRIGQYRPNKYGIEVHGGAIEFIGGLPAKQVNIGAETNFEDGYDPAAKLEFYYGNTPPSSKSVIWVDTSGDKDIWKRWDDATSTWVTAPIGPQGIQGPAGKDGNSLFTWVKYADDAQGNGMSEFPAGKKYIGLAYNKPIATESSNKADYTWSLIQGEQGIRGPSGENGQTLYTWLKYADSPTSGMSDSPTGKAYMGIAYNKTSPTESNIYGDYTWSLVKGEQGERGLQGLQGPKGDQGIKGATGENGVSSYTHIAYANSADGTSGFSVSDPINKAYIGMYVDSNPVDSTVPSRYKWSLIKGSDGEKGIQGPKGDDGRTPYFHTAWANNSTGTSGFSTTVSLGKTYIGTYTDFVEADSSDPSKYNWVLIKGDKGDKGDSGPQGLQGLQGPKGDQGIPGQTGLDGKSSYAHIAYANNESGTLGFSTTDSTNKAYIGMYVDFNANDSTDPTKYNWTLIKGADGSQGIQGPKGDNGLTPYLHIAYANNSTGTSGFSTTDPTGRTFIGTYTDYTAADSTDPSKYSWSLIKGDKGDTGAQGPQGVQGPAGKDGVSLYTWVKYADNASGGGMADTPAGKTYIGLAYNKTTATESSNAGDYSWSLIKGDRGAVGPAGSDGVTTYTWVKYADDVNGSGISDSPDGKRYLGLAYNKTTATESTNAADYSWSPLYDNVVVGARNLIPNGDFSKEKLYWRDWGTNGTKVIVNVEGISGFINGVHIVYPTADTSDLGIAMDEIPTIVGETYTLSAWVYVNSGIVGLQEGSIDLNFTNTEFRQLPLSQWNKIKFTFTARGTTTNIYIGSYNGNIDAVFTGVKFEKGNVETDWTPAPEDIDNQINEGLNNLTTEYNAAIEAKADEINLGVAQKIVDSEGNIREYVGSQIQATEASFDVRFSEIDNTTGQHESDIAEMHSYFQFRPTGLNIGKSDSPLQINISNEQMDFIDNGNTVAYVNGQKMYIDSLEVLTNLIVGNHKIEKYNNNITLIKWVGE